MPHRFLIILALTSLATGCATTVDQKQKLQTAMVCCKSPKEFQYSELPLQGDFKFDLTEKSPMFEFSSGRSFFQAIHLPTGNSSSILQVRTYLGHGSQFCPSVTFLNANHEVVETKFEWSRWQQPDTTYGGFYFVDYPIPQGGSYAVIHSEEKYLGEKLAYMGPTSVVPPISPGVVLGEILMQSLVPSGFIHYKAVWTPCEPIGSLSLSLKRNSSN